MHVHVDVVDGHVNYYSIHEQAHQERTYQEFLASKAKEKVMQLEQYYEQIIGRTQTELNSESSTVSLSVQRNNCWRQHCY